MGFCEVLRTEFHRSLYSGVFLSLDASRRETGIAMTFMALGHAEFQTGFFATRDGHREVFLLYFGATTVFLKIDLSGLCGLQTLCQLRSCLRQLPQH